MKNQTVYLSSCVPEGGLYRYELLADGQLALQDHYPAAEPMYAIRQNQIIYLLLRAPFPGSEDSGALALRIQEDGLLVPIGDLQNLGGAVACHLALSPSGRFLYTANYVSGSVTELPVLPGGDLGPLRSLIQHEGSSVHPKRQTGPHTHCTVFTPDNRYLCVVDLGLDQIVLYAVDPEAGIDPSPHFVSQSDPGYGPRHLIFAKDGHTAYCANELISSITTYRYDAGRLEKLATLSTLPTDYTGVSYCAAIKLSPDGRFVYVSNRGHDSIACFSIESDRISLVSITPCGGQSPRDFDITSDGSRLICTNERGHLVTVLPVDQATGQLQLAETAMPLAAPLCVTL
ncbi:MAG: lactonase family protein [Bacillota bacterium]|nr:lactonase family protein [Bacillota bacterium]